MIIIKLEIQIIHIRYDIVYLKNFDAESVSIKVGKKF